MPRHCTVCDHPARDAIDRALVAGVPFRNVAGQFRLTVASLFRHRQTHLPAALVQAAQAQEVIQASALLADVQALQAKTLAVLQQAEVGGEPRLVLQAVREARGNLELLAKLLGELREGATVNVLVAPEWQRVRAVLVAALAPFPEARVAVAQALRSLGDGHR